MKSIISQLLADILTALYRPFWFSLVMAVLFMFLWLYVKEEPQRLRCGTDTDDAESADVAERGWKQAAKEWLHYFKTSTIFRRTFFLSFYTACILNRTLLDRNLWEKPLSNVSGVWLIYNNGEFAAEPIENLLLFIPFIVLLLWSMGNRVLKNEKLTAVLWYSAKVTFFFSLSIEFLQLLLHLGTWQLSDLVYNTAGGMLGGVLWWLCRKCAGGRRK